MAEKQEVNWDRVEIEIVALDDDGLRLMFEAVDPPADVKEEHSGAVVDPDEIDDLRERLLTWGWSGDNAFHHREMQTPSHIGIYGDFTYFEDDERLMKAIAPFVRDGSRAIFHRRDSPYEYEAWEFKDGAVTLRDVEKVVEWV